MSKKTRIARGGLGAAAIRRGRKEQVMKNKQAWESTASDITIDNEKLLKDMICAALNNTKTGDKRTITIEIKELET